MTLLAAQDEAALAHGLQHVTVAHFRLDELDARIAQSMREPEIAHDGGHGGAAGKQPTLVQVDSAHGLHHVAVDLVAVRVHEHDAVGVAVVRDAHIGARLGHERAPIIDVSTVSQEVILVVLDIMLVLNQVSYTHHRAHGTVT